MRRRLAAGAAALLLATLPACTDTSRVSAPTGTGSLPPATSPGDSSATSLIDRETTSSTARPGEITFSFVRATEDDEQDLVDISFPVLHHPDAAVADPINDKIIESIDELVVGFTDAASAAPAADSRSTLTLQAAPELISNDVFSVSGISFDFVRGGNPTTKRVAWIFSLASASLVSPAELFIDGGLEHLAAAARDHLVSDVVGDEAAITAPEGLLPTPANFHAVWLTAAGIGVGFDQHQVAGGDVGSPTVLIPYAELLDVLDKTGVLAPLQNGSTLPEL